MTDGYDDLGPATERGGAEEIRYAVDGVTHSRTMGDLGRAAVEQAVTERVPEVRIYDERGRFDWQPLNEAQQNRLMRGTPGGYPPYDVQQAASRLFDNLDLSVEEASR